MSDDERSTNEMVRNLHHRFDGLDTQLAQLHSDHKDLQQRVTNVEREMAADIAHLDKHESEACLREEKILQRLDSVQATQHMHYESLVKHMDREEAERVWIRRTLVWLLFGVLGAIGTMILTKVFM